MKKFFTSVLIFILVINANAQFFAYTAARGSITLGSYTDLGSSGNKITTNFLGQPLGSDDNSNVQNIGFTFNFSGTDYTQFTVNTNGFIKLGNDTVNRAVCRDVLGSNDLSATNVIYAINTQLLSNTSSDYRVFTQGSAGSRTCTIQFKAIADSGCLTCAPSDPQYDYLEFQIVLVEGTNDVQIILGNWTANANTPNFVSTNTGLKLNSRANSVNVSKSSQTAFDGATFLDGYYTGNRFNIRNSLAPSVGITYSFKPLEILTNNTRITSLRYNGKVPKNYNNYASIVVQNIGKTTYATFPVTLTTSGANTASQVINVPNFAPGDIDTVFFNVLNWANTGNTWNQVKLPTDDDMSDNLDTMKQSVTTNVIGTAFDTSTAFRIGSNSSQIEMATLFKNSTANKITSLTAYIRTAGQQYRFYVYTVDADTPKTKIYSGSNLTSVAGKNTLNLTAAQYINVTGDFFVVVVQTSTTVNLGLGYNFEPSVRRKNFYFRSPQGSTLPAASVTSSWFDAGTSTLPFTKFMIDVAFQTPPLNPVKFSYFTAEKNGKTNLLKWQTFSEVNSLGFEVQKSSDGKEFSKIGFVNSTGNPTSITNYNFTDEKLINGLSYYRLKQLDKDGKFEYSEIITTNYSDNNSLEITAAYPNPTKNDISINFNSKSEEKLNINIISLTGKVVQSQVVNPKIGDNKVVLNTTALPAGNYILTVAEINSEKFATTKFIKQ